MKQKQIVGLFREHPELIMDKQTMLKEMNFEYSKSVMACLSTQLSYLVKSGELQKLGKGRYQLAGKKEQTPAPVAPVSDNDKVPKVD